MNSQNHSHFGILCRTNRVEKKMKQREVAHILGIQVSTYGNVESAAHRVISEKRAEKLADVFRLEGGPRAEFLAAWATTPISEYSLKQRETWAKRNAARSKSKGYDRIFQAMMDLIALTLTVARPEVPLCACGLDGKLDGDPSRSCEICTALEELGLPAFTTGDAVMSQLAALQDKIDATRAKAEAARVAS